MGLSVYVYWPRAFQRSFNVINLAPNGADLIIAIRNDTYREKVLELNPMYAKIIPN